ncbi:LysR family transcriptional regulator, glycine cleavage system transcriptional activator [Monaibacterium marinum]|uniref:LysR family transcriptional regulator, glycine cleavage system transcriptional activator n=1 Tax=Pontivivens marinum TaxID=1690039 RepID=A0A2C9CT73_9RHOB|nr:LysR family transcriptional regulator [Monaibacterium marinum]SOH94524.1 LysR family transcriptional regulator, glycine cleavage system transcriptional activator [Monaibacterium marinum]
MDDAPLPTLAALRAFEATARHLGFSAAGRELNVTHAAVAQQVRGLERELDVVLVQRSGRGLALTADGSDLAHDLSEGFASFRRGISRIREQKSALPVRIAITSSFAVSWFMPRLASFREAHPDIELALHPSADLVDMAAGDHDLAIRFGSGDWAGVISEPFLPTSFVICAAPALVADWSPDCPEDLLALPWFDEPGRNEQAIWLKAMGLAQQRASNVTQVPGYMMLAALREGQGIAATTRAFVQQDVDAGRLTILWEDETPGRGYHLLYRRGPLRSQVAAVRKWLKRQA